MRIGGERIGLAASASEFVVASSQVSRRALCFGFVAIALQRV